MDSTLFSQEQLKSSEELLFEHSELGRIHAQIPFKSLADQFRQYKPNGSTGRPAHLRIEGGLGLMFLKHHLGLSDEMLLQRLNSDVYLQLFCFTRIALEQPIRDKDLVGRWRRFFASHMDIEELQAILAQHWSAQLEDKHVLLDDATCYESHIKYPTDIKLLYDCCVWLHIEVGRACRFHSCALPRFDKYYKAMDRVKHYQRLRRKPHKKARRLVRSLLHWLRRLQGMLQELLDRGPAYHKQLKPKFYERLKTTRIIFEQQQYMLAHNVRRVAHRIVSLYKPYIRPIIRGKENKRYEFGAKVHASQVDGLNFIEHLSFEAFHEGNRMWYSIAKQQKRMGTKCRWYGADRIYATNKNRRKAKKLGVQTCFPAKGRPPKNSAQAQQARTHIATARATRLEGSFGTEKQHYGLGRIKARTQDTEVAWIFFGIHTANVVRLARRIAKRAKSPPLQKAA